MNKFKKEVVLYGLAIALNRGSMLLFMPPIVALLGIGDYGMYAYIVAIVYIIAPFLSLNISAGIVREGATDIRKAVYIQKLVTPRITIVAAALAVISYLISFYFDTFNFITITILLGASEALNNIQFAHFRADEKHSKYFVFSLLKVFLFILTLYVLNYLNYLSLETLLISQLSLNTILYIYFSFNTLFRSEFEKIVLKPIFIFSAFLLPHTLAQWVMNASSRLIIKNLINEHELGIFSISFSIASIAMIINSGISLVIPQHMIKNYSRWIKHKHIFNFYLYYSVIFVILYLALITGIYFDYNYLHIVKYYDENVISYMTFIFSGFYFLGYYYYYSNILFYHKKSKEISLVTITTSVLSIIITFLLIYYNGTSGAAWGTLVTYVLYFALIYFAAIKQEPLISGKFIKYIVVCLTSISVFFIFNYLINRILFS